MARPPFTPVHNTRDLRDYLDPAARDIRNLFRAGAPPASVAQWLRSPEANDLRNQILASWRGMLGLQAGQPAAAVQIPANAISPHDFRVRFFRLCVPGNQGPAIDDPDVPGVQPARFLLDLHQVPNDQRLNRARQEIRELAAIYSAVWDAARASLGHQALWDARDQIQLSGLEAQAYIHHLTASAMVGHALGMHAPAIRQDAQALGVPLAEADIVPADFWVMVQPHPPVQPPQHTELTPEARAVVKRVTESYKNALDAVTSFLPPGAGGNAPSAPAIQESALPTLLDRWVDSFARLLQEHVKEAEVVGDDLLILRLAPMTGRYGEVPQRPQTQELTPEPKATIWPTHPSRLTESYMLEPIPARFFFAHYPAVFLRQDYALELRHRGYGIGANLYSMSLLPQEEQSIVVKSFKDTRTKVSESTAENLFEEAGSETANDFATEMARENQQESSNQSSFSVNAKASASFLFGSASVESGYSSQGSEREFAKNTSNLSKKLASKLSSKRTVTVDTKRTRETEEELHTEITTERKVKNPNLGHTVTFHWFQMTRKLQESLVLEDAKLVYTSGKHNLIRGFVNGDVPASVRRRPDLQPDDLFERMPPDVARRMPPNSAILVVAEPYTEVVSLSAANSFFLRTLRPAKASEANARVWEILGYGVSAPDGLGVTAFPDPRKPALVQAQWGAWAPLDAVDPSQAGAAANAAHVAADRITIRRRGVAPNPQVFYLPNLDLRYAARQGQMPARHTAAPHDAFSLPRVLYAEERVISTNGVYCDAMVGQCTALEDYLQRFRELDLLDKKLQVGQHELEFKWALARDNQDVILQERDRELIALVKDKAGSVPFEQRLALERAESAQRKQMADTRLEMHRVEQEIELLKERVSELKARTANIGQDKQLNIKAPDGTKVTVNAKVDLSGDAEPGESAGIKVE
jgi:hypothetical protein